MRGNPLLGPARQIILRRQRAALAVPGGWVCLCGECMRITAEQAPALTLRLPGGDSLCLSPSRVYDDYSVGFSLPALAPGEYPARYSNGFGETDVLLRVAQPPEAAWPKAIFPVEVEGVPTDGHSDCTAALQALLDRVSAAAWCVCPRAAFILPVACTSPAAVCSRAQAIAKPNCSGRMNGSAPCPRRMAGGIGSRFPCQRPCLWGKMISPLRTLTFPPRVWAGCSPRP